MSPVAILFLIRALVDFAADADECSWSQVLFDWREREAMIVGAMGLFSMWEELESYDRVRVLVCERGRWRRSGLMRFIGTRLRERDWH